jgi:hypothetical protein
VPEFIDPVFAKTSPKRSFSVIENERFGRVFVKEPIPPTTKNLGLIYFFLFLELNLLHRCWIFFTRRTFERSPSLTQATEHFLQIVAVSYTNYEFLPELFSADLVARFF